ncbi:MAG: hypothetical protein SGARI_000896 [Bacillariaceae sp.]
MKFTTAYHTLAAATLLASTAQAFSPMSTAQTGMMRPTVTSSQSPRHMPKLSLSDSAMNAPSNTNGSNSSLNMNTHSPEEQQTADNEIDRLKIMAQKLRAEAAALEADRAQELANAATIAFEKFDKNNDGVITLEELKQGLEKSFKTELSEERVQKLMNEFDASGDGTLQVEEMVTVDQFRNRLEYLKEEEKRLAKEAAIAAKQEEEATKLAEARANAFNDGAPSNRDKLVSVLPYLFPLMDSLQFGRFLLVENSDNPAVTVLALLYAAYRSIPFSGFIAFFALNFLSGNPGINRQVRFNMQQAIYLDIALFFPGLIAAVVGLASGGNLPPGITEITNDVVFGTLLLTVAYASISSLLGVTPDKIPFISGAVEDRMPTVDMFDDEGRFIPREMREKKDDEEKKD